MVKGSTASSLELENMNFHDQVGIHSQGQYVDVDTGLAPGENAVMSVRPDFVGLETIYKLIVGSGSPVTVLLGGGSTTFVSWSDFEQSPVPSVRNNLYTPALLENFSVLKFDIIQNYLKNNSDLYDVLIRLPDFLVGKIAYHKLSLDYFLDKVEEMEFLIVKLSIDDIDEPQTTKIETYILDEFFYPRSNIIRGRLIFSM